MKYIEAIKDKIKNITPRPSVFDITIGRWRSNSLEFCGPYRSKYVDDCPVHQEIIKSNIVEKLNKDRTFKINEEETLSRVIRSFQQQLTDSFYEVCPAKRPRQTKFFKSWSRFNRYLMTGEDEVNNTIISLVLYFKENKKDMHPQTIHGKSYYALLQALVKKYGK